ncbi:MAG TPA: DUF1565 domain-containing protein, partial [Leptolyngbyaceae cyanobacterium M65_K2018_010]|nr:DUF1565 domain-containing protein [Leptolyngbyaceae cyanobacterium M65_K2018_010]
MTPRTLLSLATAATALVLGIIAPASAEIVAPAADRPTTPARSGASPSYTLVHVSAVAGSDGNGDGSQLRPYQTITHALRIAPANAIVLLAPGEYSEASGERFPIYLKPGVTVQGASVAGLGQTIIRGSGLFSSATSGLVHTTIVGVDGAGLGNVVVTNTGAAGYGLAVETGRPVIRQNQFVGSRYGGVYLFGDSAALIEENQFRGNGVVGLAIAGQSTAEIRGNRFEQTGIGIRVAPGAQPLIINNIVVQNQEGLLLDGHAQPRLEDNIIAQNRRNGVIEFQTAVKAEASGAVRPAIAPPPALQPVVPPTFEVEAVRPSPIQDPSLSYGSVISPPVPSSRVDMIPPPPVRPVPTAGLAPAPGRIGQEGSPTPAVASPPLQPSSPSVPADLGRPEPEAGSASPAEPPALAQDQPQPVSLALASAPAPSEDFQGLAELPLQAVEPLPDSLPLAALAPAGEADIASGTTVGTMASSSASPTSTETDPRPAP